MVQKRALPAVLLLAGFVSGIPTVQAQSDQPLQLSGTWQTERVELNDGRVLYGLIERESEQYLEFLEVHRRPGRPLAAAGHFFSTQDVHQVDRLPEDDRVVLRRQVNAIRSRAVIEPGRLHNIHLTPNERDGIQSWSYSGPWFRMEATLEPPEVRQMVVHLEQIFRAFAQVLSAEELALTDPTPDVTVHVFGDDRQYAAYLRREGLLIRNPAFFDPERVLVVASSNLNLLLDTARAVEEEHTSLLRAQFPKNGALLEALASREEQLRLGDYSPIELRRLRTQFVQRFRDEEATLLSQMRRVERRNREAVNQEREKLQERLFHEAFHAYFETRLIRPVRGRAPLWLLEGLAQVFESALFDGEDQLRIDAPDAERLVNLQEDLASPAALRLADLLSADQSKFLIPHDASGRTSEQHYLYAWGLAYYLVFHYPTLSKQHLLDYAAGGGSQAPAEFEELVARPMDEFEVQWRNTILSMRRQ